MDIHYGQSRETYHGFIHSDLCHLLSYTLERPFRPLWHFLKLPPFERQEGLQKFPRRNGSRKFTLHLHPKVVHPPVSRVVR